MLAIRISEDLEQRLTRLSEKTGRTKSYYARKAIQEFIEDREDYLLAISVLEQKNPTISLDEWSKKNGKYTYYFC
jgi:RHH-type rel operon transcriptional repressor/antitoxin RelB